MVCDEVAQSPVLPQAKCAQKTMKAKTHRRVHCMKARTLQHKYRCCTNLREEDLVFLRQSAGLQAVPRCKRRGMLIIKQFGISRRK